MRLPQFDIRDQRSVKIAQCGAVPPLMLVAGPNGAGKSTLLNALRAGGQQGIIYVGPHRAMRRQHVQQRHLIAGKISLEDLLQRPDIQGFEGIQLLGGNRDPWGYDDSANYLKHALCQIEIDRSQAIAARFDKFGEIAKGSLSDPWKPLRELTNNLLPHLMFDRIDASNRDLIRCLFQVHGKDVVVDLDDLSSGEKSIIQMFYPLIEHQTKELLNEIQGAPPQAGRPELCILVDEPELHLHPNLQLKVLDYLRVLTTGTSTQVILATHSPTMVEYASFEELYLLRPPELVAPGANQLVPVADNEERLRTLRDFFGGTSNMTAMQPVIVVEGRTEDDLRTRAADRKLYRALHSGFDHATIISAGGKGECKALVASLSSALGTFSSKLRAVALLDRDYQEQADTPDIHLLPVAMIENLLLDPDAIWEAIQSVVEKAGLLTVDDVATAIDTVLDELEAAEIARRTVSSLGVVRFRAHTPVNEISTRAATFADDVLKRYSAETVETVRASAENAVAELKKGARRREEFHGKSVLDAFYKKHLHATGMQKGIFAFEAARYARRRKSVATYFNEFFTKLEEEAAPAV